MAERRMFSKRIVNSARFLKMPISTQCLYFHLGLHADDDGVVEAYTIMNVVGATEDDLKILVAKKFVNVLNEDLVTYITDWRENNKLRADRKVDSIYKDLLIQVIPDIELLEKKQRADRKPKLIDDNGTSQGQPMDCIGKYSIGKYRLGEDSIDQYIYEDRYNEELNNSSNISAMSKLYQKNIGMINGVIAEYIKEIAELIDIDLFKRAVEICTERNALNYKYLKTIITNWMNVNIFTYEQLESYELQKKSKKGGSNNGKYQEYAEFLDSQPTGQVSAEEMARRAEVLGIEL